MEPEQRPRTEDWYPLVQRTRVPATEREKARANQRIDGNRNRRAAADHNGADQEPGCQRQALSRAEAEDPASAVARREAIHALGADTHRSTPSGVPPGSRGTASRRAASVVRSARSRTARPARLP